MSLVGSSAPFFFWRNQLVSAPAHAPLSPEATPHPPERRTERIKDLAHPPNPENTTSLTRKIKMKTPPKNSASASASAAAAAKHGGGGRGSFLGKKPRTWLFVADPGTFSGSPENRVYVGEFFFGCFGGAGRRLRVCLLVLLLRDASASSAARDCRS